MQQIASDDISLNYWKKEFYDYSWSHFYNDLMSGFSVSMLTVPQAIAYALLAGLPVSSGLYAAIFSSLIVSLFCSSKHLLVGPSNSISILLQTGINEIIFNYYRDVPAAQKEMLVLAILTQFMLLVGLIQLLASGLKLGRLTHFVSQSVILGYFSGVTVGLFISQLFVFFAIPTPTVATSLIERAFYVIRHLFEINLPTTILGCACLITLFFYKRMSRKIPAGAMMLLTFALFTYVADYFFYYFGSYKIGWIDFQKMETLFRQISLLGETSSSNLLPILSLPYFDTTIMNHLLPIAFAVSLLSIVETISTSKAVAANSGQRLSTNQEIFGLGLGNFFSAFTSAMPVSGSISRSSMNYHNGGKTRLAGVFNVISVMFMVAVFGFLVGRIPNVAFAALLITASFNIVNFKQLIICLKATRSDASVFLITFVSCLCFSFDIAFYIGIIISISLYLKKAAVPQLVEFTVDDDGTFHRVDHHMNFNDPKNKKRAIRFIKVEGELFFGAADLFQATLKAFAEDDDQTKVLILQLKNARDLDATACFALQQLHEYLKNSNRHLIACGVTHQTWDVLSDSGMIELIGKSNLFIFDERHPSRSVQKAFLRANFLIAQESKKIEVATQTKQEELFSLEQSSSIPAMETTTDS